jgi:uncharacterized protein (TIGR02996 family)
MDQNEALLEAIYESPDDDAPRLVYMDYLQDRGDPRGEFLSLQMKRLGRALTREEARTERQLLADHVDRWVPAEVLSKIKRVTVRFERGFLARCHLRQSEQPVGSRLAGHAAWRTVHTLTAEGTGFGANRILLAPELAGLRRHHIPPGRFVFEYLGDPTPKQLELLSFCWFPGQERALIAALRDSTSFPHLRHLVVFLREADALRELLETDLAARLDHLSLWDRRTWDMQPYELHQRVRNAGFDGFRIQRQTFG